MILPTRQRDSGWRRVLENHLEALAVFVVHFRTAVLTEEMCPAVEWEATITRATVDCPQPDSPPAPASRP